MHSLGYYTGWAVVLVIAFVLPLIIVFIEYMKRVNRKLSDMKGKLDSLFPDAEKGINNDSRNTDL